MIGITCIPQHLLNSPNLLLKVFRPNLSLGDGEDHAVPQFFVRQRHKGLGLRVNIDVHVEILFGLGVWAFAMINIITENIMNNSIVNSCVWCGVAFLRGHGGTLPSQMRDWHMLRYLPVPGET